MQTPLRSLSLPARLRNLIRFLGGEPARECRVEFLESRIAPAIFVWDAGGGADTSWHNPLNWSPDGVPSESDTAILNIDKTITLTTSANVGTFQHDNVPFVGENSTLDISPGATLTVLTDFTWNDGTESGGGTLVVAAGATFHYTASGVTTWLSERTLNLVGTATFSSSVSSSISLSNDATINNSGVLDFQSSISFAGSGTINNLAGATLKKTTSIYPVTLQNGVAFTNAGTVRAEAGALIFHGGYIQTAGSSELAGGTFTIRSTPFQLNGGELTGTGMFDGSINNNGGVIRPGGTGAVGTISTGSTSTYTQGVSGILETEIAGTSVGQFDVFAPGTAVLAGTLNAPLLGGFSPAAGEQYRVLTSWTVTGTFTTAPDNVGVQYNAQNVTLLGGATGLPTVVTTELDVVNATDGVVSLREAILFANAQTGPDTITFNIPGPGVKTIALTSALPTITGPVKIDGYTQPGAAANTKRLKLGTNAVLRIELNGADAGAIANGLTITGGDSTVQGLVINGFEGNGILISGNGGNSILGNFIGTNASGDTALGNHRNGVTIASGTDNRIGDGTRAGRNVISGNGDPANIHYFNGAGVFIYGSGTNGHTVSGNLVGTDATGLVALGNQRAGIAVRDNASANTVKANVISGNFGLGLEITLDATNNTVTANTIGAGVDRMTPLGNADVGVFVGYFSTGNTIGGASAGLGNFIAFNMRSGVKITNSSPDNQIYANTIAGNQGHGIEVFHSANTIIGLVSPPNIIIDNRGAGIRLAEEGTTRTLVQGNFVGVIPGGNVAHPNGGAGILIRDGATRSDIGGPSDGNVIAGNTGPGVRIDDADFNLVRNNRIGKIGLPNGAGVSVNNSEGIRVGGTIDSEPTSELNIIAHNAGPGIKVSNRSSVNTRGNFIAHNGGLGIDLVDGADRANGVTPNDPKDADAYSGPNGLLNFPKLTSVTRTATANGFIHQVSGTYSGPPGEYIIIDIYANKSADESGFGEGQFLIHSFGVSIGSTGRATFSETFSTGRTSIFGSPLGTLYTSQAQTNSLEFGDQSSEFSNAVRLSTSIGGGSLLFTAKSTESRAGIRNAHSTQMPTLKAFSESAAR